MDNVTRRLLLVITLQGIMRICYANDTQQPTYNTDNRREYLLLVVCTYCSFAAIRFTASPNCTDACAVANKGTKIHFTLFYHLITFLLRILLFLK